MSDTFAATTILLVSMRIPEIKFQLEESFETMWKMALTILKRHAEYISTASRAIQVLETFRQRTQGCLYRGK